MSTKTGAEGMLLDAASFGPQIHADRGLLYGDLPYKIHLQTVVNTANYFRPLLKMSPEDFYDVLAACWLHDTIEDCGINYNYVSKRFNGIVAEYVWAVTGFGRNRIERNACIIPKVQGKVVPTYIKLCDKIANMVFSKFVDPGSRMYGRYVIEWTDFKQKFYMEELKPMFDYVDKLIDLT